MLCDNNSTLGDTQLKLQWNKKTILESSIAAMTMRVEGKGKFCGKSIDFFFICGYGG